MLPAGKVLVSGNHVQLYNPSPTYLTANFLMQSGHSCSLVLVLLFLFLGRAKLKSTAADRSVRRTFHRRSRPWLGCLRSAGWQGSIKNSLYPADRSRSTRLLRSFVRAWEDSAKRFGQSYAPVVC